MPSVLEVSQPMAQPLDQTIKTTIPVLDPGPINVGKVNYNGIEVVGGIMWQGWEPGREYTKNIVLKNVHVKTKKLKYNVPNSRFFSTLYPKPVVLSAGTSFSLPVTFRPLEKVVYEDKIEFHNKTLICVQQMIPYLQHLKFKILGKDLETKVHWEVNEPFTIQPTDAILKSKAKRSFKATFKPTTACVFQAEAVCRYGEEGSFGKVTNLEGIGKYPHILVSSPGKPASSLTQENLESVVSFGPTAVGATIQKVVELHNLSTVRAPYKIEHPTKLNRIDTVFSCPQKQGIVPPMGSVKIPVVYSPNTVDTQSIDYFNVISIGNISKAVIKCSGSSQGPNVHLSTKAVNFMQIDVGDVATRPIDIINNSDQEAVFQFMLDCNESVFKFERLSGVIRPNTRQTIILQFIPPYPINYHRKVTCMIHNQGPLFLDLLGTCHSEMVKPAVLQTRHLDLYKCHVERGLSLYPPEQLNELLREGKLEVDDAGALMMPASSQSDDTVNKDLPHIPPMDEYFNDGFHSDIINFVPHVSLDVNIADFGNCQNLRVIEDKIVNITNHTKGKITVQWIEGADKTFSVMPATMDIPPLKSCAFQVTFRPCAPNQFYGCDLECFTFYKSLRDYRLVEDKTHCPPWCLTLNCTGQTFMPNNETFLPRYNIDSSNLIFPAVNTKESTYRTLLLTNTGTTPILYDIQKDTTNTYAVKPVKALMKGQHQIFVVKITPNEVKTYKHDLVLKLNDNEKYNKEIELWGSAEAPKVLLDTNGDLFFKPTCVGTASNKSYRIKNICRIPLR
ncbi:hypothetical protein KUTeg_002173 [Tegillarca granosa]|uniref:CFAP65 fourth Ig-like domain-containing protein n=1 Tax=Tegillarca granosa TaxID=220873 RepID=A0ABQ9FTK7_TEGGR|nr:hypothetical protein KUTeg_002173 [Tegillarca granosa]